MLLPSPPLSLAAGRAPVGLSPAHVTQDLKALVFVNNHPMHRWARLYGHRFLNTRLPPWVLAGRDKAKGRGHTPQFARRKGLLGLTRDRNFSTERCSSDLNSGTGVWMSLQEHCPYHLDALPIRKCYQAPHPSIPAAACSLRHNMPTFCP